MNGSTHTNKKRLKSDENLALASYDLLADLIKEFYVSVLGEPDIEDSDWVIAYRAWEWGTETIAITDDDSLQVAMRSLRTRGRADIPLRVILLVEFTEDDPTPEVVEDEIPFSRDIRDTVVDLTEEGIR
ncbi:hypothetical protein N0V83_005703 [Neocucurbitaria cava]|uniref:Uncharacterized protein n=1 Tax=Neocucurbitaria cava TaxID=798079 RepID=A0A9W9CLI3_9PLEO|nr:hypothetical protein N0V83_005703 [Neocucurbitaria cava]